MITRRTWLKRAALTAVSLPLATAGYAHWLEPAWLDLNWVEVTLPKLDMAFRGYRIAHLSDVHADATWMTATRLAEIVAVVNAHAPDLVLITGDFVTSTAGPPQYGPLAALRELKASDGVFAVLGNHDHWSGAEQLRALLPQFGVTELADRAHTIRRGAANLHLLGLDDLWPERDLLLPVEAHAERLDQLLAQLPKKEPIILAVHEPDFADVSAATRRIGLQLSGHSHGGQVHIPAWGAPILPPLGWRYPEGRYTIDKMQHYTNRGLGLLSPQFRFACRPEIALIILGAQSNDPRPTEEIRPDLIIPESLPNLSS